MTGAGVPRIFEEEGIAADSEARLRLDCVPPGPLGICASSKIWVKSLELRLNGLRTYVEAYSFQ